MYVKSAYDSVKYILYIIHRNNSQSLALENYKIWQIKIRSSF